MAEGALVAVAPEEDEFADVTFSGADLVSGPDAAAVSAESPPGATAVGVDAAVSSVL